MALEYSGFPIEPDKWYSFPIIFLGNQFIEKIKSKMFSLYLIKYAVENASKKIPPYFFPLFKRNETAYNMKNHPLIDNKK